MFSSGKISMARAAAALTASLFAFPLFAQLPSLFPDEKQSSAKLVQMVGQVSVMKGREPWVLNAGDFVQARQEIVTGIDGYAQFQVNDGSTFEVFPNSHLIFRNNS